MRFPATATTTATATATSIAETMSRLCFIATTQENGPTRSLCITSFYCKFRISHLCSRDQFLYYAPPLSTDSMWAISSDGNSDIFDASIPISLTSRVSSDGFA